VASVAEEWAKRLADCGLSILPLQEGSKEPIKGQSWKALKTTNKNKIEEWFSKTPNMNYGVCPGNNHVVIDLDIKGETNGIVALVGIEFEQEEFISESSLTIETPSGGRHIYLHTDRPFSNANTFPDGIDVRGKGGYVVGPGCRLPNGNYTPITNGGPTEAPNWVISYLKSESTTDDKPTQPTILELDKSQDITRAIEFLKLRDPAIEGRPGSKCRHKSTLR